jgi:hypothetical protein
MTSFHGGRDTGNFADGSVKVLLSRVYHFLTTKFDDKKGRQTPK